MEYNLDIYFSLVVTRIFKNQDTIVGFASKNKFDIIISVQCDLDTIGVELVRNSHPLN